MNQLITPLVAAMLLIAVLFSPEITKANDGNEDGQQQANPWKRNFGQIKISPEKEVSQVIHVDLGTINAEEFVIEIENQAGTKIMEKHFKDKSFNLVVEELQTGAYLLKIVTTRYVYTKSFTKA